MLEHVEKLTPADRYQLLLQTGLLDSAGSWSAPLAEQLLRVGTADPAAIGRIRELLGGVGRQREIRKRIGEELAQIAQLVGFDDQLRQFVASLAEQRQDAGRVEAVRRVHERLEGPEGLDILRRWEESSRAASEKEDPVDLLWRYLPPEGVDEFRSLLVTAFPSRDLDSLPKEGLTTQEDVRDEWKATLNDKVRTLSDDELEADGVGQKGREEKLAPDAVKDILETADALFVASDDVEAVEYFLASQLSKLWTIAFDDIDAALDQVEKWSGTAFGNTVKDRFIEECVAVNNLRLPSDWSFRPVGAPPGARPFPPRTMQKLTAVRLRDTERRGIGNWSLMGGGKTVSAILAADCLKPTLTMVVCPNVTVSGWSDEIKNVFPDAVVSQGWTPPPLGAGRRFVVLNIEKFQQPTAPKDFENLLSTEAPQVVVLDEVHKFKQRDSKLKRRRQNLLAFLTLTKEQEPSLRILGMSGTPVINNLYEARSLIELCTLKDHGDLQTKPTAANAMRVHARLATLGLRYRPNYLAEFDDIERIRIDIGHRYEDLLGKELYQTELVCLEEKIPSIVAHASPRAVVYSELVEGVHERIAEALREAGFSVGFFNGQRKDGLAAFQRRECDCLVASQALGTGVDGLQACTDLLIVATLPWTSSDFDQLLGRFFRPRSDDTVGSVRVVVPWTFISPSGELEKEWSMDGARWRRIRYKASLADAAVDGILPEGQLRNAQQAHSDLQTWLKRLRSDADTPSVDRRDLKVPMPEATRAKVARRIGDLTAFHARVASSSSGTTHQRLNESKENWYWYHSEVEEAALSWPFIPRDRCVAHIKKRVDRRKSLVVADIGCGLAKLASALADSCTVHSFDHVALDDRVQPANVCERIPLEDETVDVAVLCLVLDWQKDWEKALAEASRILALDGQLLVWETRRFVEGRADGIQGLEQVLDRYSLKTLQVFDEHFVGFIAVKL